MQARCPQPSALQRSGQPASRSPLSRLTVRRSNPQISPAQLKSLATVSSVSARAAISQRQTEELLAEIRHDRDQWEVKHSRVAITESKLLLWLSRIALLPLTVLLIGLVLVVALGLWSCELKVIQRYSSAIVVRTNSPIEYWFSVLYHSALAVFVCWLTVKCFATTQLRRKSELRGRRAPESSLELEVPQTHDLTPLKTPTNGC